MGIAQKVDVFVHQVFAHKEHLPQVGCLHGPVLLYCHCRTPVVSLVAHVNEVVPHSSQQHSSPYTQSLYTDSRPQGTPGDGWATSDGQPKE